jgi:predicted nucleotidyltransferase
MRPSEAVHRHRAKIKEIALGHRVADVRIFGSAARGDDVEGSDLVTLPPENVVLG